MYTMEFSYHKEQWNHNNCRKIGPTKKRETCAQRPEGSKGISHAGTWGPAFQIEGWGSLKETFVHNILVTGKPQRVRPEKSDKKWEGHMTCSPTTDLRVSLWMRWEIIRECKQRNGLWTLGRISSWYATKTMDMGRDRVTSRRRTNTGK